MIQIRNGYGKRVKNSFAGVIFGMLLVPGSFLVLGWNERDAVRQTGAITEIEKVAIADVPAESIDGQYDGKLVHMSSEAATDEILEFPDFGIRENAIRLSLDASIYQWVEHRKEKDNNTTYSYNREWVDQPINSSDFRESGHSNDGSEKHFRDDRAQAENVTFGAFSLTKNLIGQINADEKYVLPASVALDVRPQGEVKDGVFYTGNPGDPQIGDERVEVSVVGPRHAATVMATQRGSTFASYETKVGIAKELLYLGKLSKGEVIDRQRTEAALKRWALRATGFVMMWIGFAMILSPLKAIVSFIPFASRLLEGAVGIVTFLLALVLTSLVIAVAWFAVRPILSGILLAIAIGGFILIYRQKAAPEASLATAGPSAGPPPPPPPPPVPPTAT